MFALLSSKRAQRKIHVSLPLRERNNLKHQRIPVPQRMSSAALGAFIFISQSRYCASKNNDNSTMILSIVFLKSIKTKVEHHNVMRHNTRTVLKARGHVCARRNSMPRCCSSHLLVSRCINSGSTFPPSLLSTSQNLSLRPKRRSVLQYVAALLFSKPPCITECSPAPSPPQTWALLTSQESRRSSRMFLFHL